MSDTTKTNFLTRHKKFLIRVLTFYLIGIIGGIYFFHSPNLSKDYLQKYEQEHRIYKEISKHPDYYKFLQRPHLYKGSPEELEKFNFAANYEKNPDFLREKERIFYYTLWFKTLDFLIIIFIVFYFGWQPLLNYTYTYQRHILNKQNEIDNRIRQSNEEEVKAKNLYQTLPNVIKEREYYKESFLAQRLSEIEKQNQQALAQIEFLLKTRKQEAILHCINEVKRQLINESIKKAEQELVASETPERLEQTVEKFNFLITMIS